MRRKCRCGDVGRPFDGLILGSDLDMQTARKYGQRARRQFTETPGAVLDDNRSFSVRWVSEVCCGHRF